MNLKNETDFEKQVFTCVCTGDYDRMFVAIKTNIQEAIAYRSKTGVSLVHWATTNEQVDIVKFLIANGADKTVVDELGKTPADLVHINSPKTLKTILDVDNAKLIAANTALYAGYKESHLNWKVKPKEQNG